MEKYLQKAVLVSLLILIIKAQQGIEEPSTETNEQVRKEEYRVRDANKMNYQNVQSYTIKTTGVDSFYLTPQVYQEVKCELYLYWKEANIFISSEYREGEEVRVIVYEDNQRILADQSFYMVTGIKFNVKQGSSYEVRILSTGRIQKLVSMTINKMLDISSKLIALDDLLSKQQKISKISNQIQAFFSISQRNFIVEHKLTGQVLSSTQIYMGYEIVQILIILIITIMQTVFITKVLNTSSIV